MHLETLLFLLFVATAGILRLLTSKAGRGSEPPSQDSTPVPRTNLPPADQPLETDEERIRRFLEALGQPTSAKLPQPVKQRPVYQKPVVLPNVGPFAPPYPPLVTRPPAQPAPRTTLPSAAAMRPVEAKGITTTVVDATIFEVQEGAPMVEPVPVATTLGSQTVPDQTGENIAALVRASSGLRDAIILREILGPPLGLKGFEVIGSA